MCIRDRLRAACELGRDGGAASDELSLLSAAATDAAAEARGGAGDARRDNGDGVVLADVASPPRSPSEGDGSAVARLRKKAADIAIAYAFWLGWSPRTPQLGNARLPAALAPRADSSADCTSAPAADAGVDGSARGARAEHARRRLLAPSYDELRADTRALLAACAAGSLFDELEQRPPSGHATRRALHAAKEAIVCLWELLSWSPHPLGLGPGKPSGPGAHLTPSPRSFAELRERAARALADAPRDAGPADGPLLCSCAICCRFEAVRAMADEEPELVLALCGAPDGVRRFNAGDEPDGADVRALTFEAVPAAVSPLVGAQSTRLLLGARSDGAVDSDLCVACEGAP